MASVLNNLLALFTSARLPAPEDLQIFVQRIRSLLVNHGTAAGPGARTYAILHQVREAARGALSMEKHSRS